MSLFIQLCKDDKKIKTQFINDLQSLTRKKNDNFNIITGELGWEKTIVDFLTGEPEKRYILKIYLLIS